MATERKRGNGPVKSHNWAISEQARKVLKAHAAEWGIAESVILDYLCCTHLRAVKIVRWCDAPREGAEADLASRASDAAPTLPISEALTPAPPESPAPAPRQGRGPARPRREAG